MFWRIVRRLLGANRGRLLVILLALGAGAAVTAALLNLQVDAKSRITTEFRVFGANVIISARTQFRLREFAVTPIPCVVGTASNDGAEIASRHFALLHRGASRQTRTSNPFAWSGGHGGQSVITVMPSPTRLLTPFRCRCRIQGSMGCAVGRTPPHYCMPSYSSASDCGCGVTRGRIASGRPPRSLVDQRTTSVLEP